MDRNTAKMKHAAPPGPNHLNDACCVQQVEPLKGPAYDSLRTFIHDREHEALAIEISNRRKSGITRNHSSSSFVYFESIMFSKPADDDESEVEWVLREST